jgi:hypothetical protein
MPEMRDWGISRRRKALISAKNVLYSKKMSKAPQPRSSLWGALFFGRFRGTLN